jgi:hypothetical protein
MTHVQQIETSVKEEENKKKINELMFSYLVVAIIGL